jgi:hypothetical protein
MACYLCLAADDLRACAYCKRPVCRACATRWPMWRMAVLYREAHCRPCTLAAARRDVADAREWLRGQGVEPGF